MLLSAQDKSSGFCQFSSNVPSGSRTKFPGSCPAKIFETSQAKFFEYVFLVHHAKMAVLGMGSMGSCESVSEHNSRDIRKHPKVQSFDLGRTC